jgi:hypothetical protein
VVITGLRNVTALTATQKRRSYPRDALNNLKQLQATQPTSGTPSSETTAAQNASLILRFFLPVCGADAPPPRRASLPATPLGPPRPPGAQTHGPALLRHENEKLHTHHSKVGHGLARTTQEARYKHNGNHCFRQQLKRTTDALTAKFENLRSQCPWNNAPTTPRQNK